MLRSRTAAQADGMLSAPDGWARARRRRLPELGVLSVQRRRADRQRHDDRGQTEPYRDVAWAAFDRARGVGHVDGRGGARLREILVALPREAPARGWRAPSATIRAVGDVVAIGAAVVEHETGRE